MVVKNSEIHSIVFIPNGKNNWTTVKAIKWLKNHNLTPIKRVDKVKSKQTGKITQLRYRIKDPALFKTFTTKKTNDEINIVIGFRK